MYIRSNNLLLIFACALLSTTAQATTYNTSSDFSLVSNPNGVWSYLVSSNLMTHSNVGSGTLAGLNYWSNGGSIPNSAIIGNNTTASQLNFETIRLPESYLLLDPESLAGVGVTFTAPTAGNYTITGNFLGIDVDENSHPVGITDNGTSIFSGVIGSYGASDAFSLTETLNAGDVIDFRSATGSTYTFLSTGLSATITTGTTTPVPPPAIAPEPASIAIAGLGFTAIFFIQRKNRVRVR